MALVDDILLYGNKAQSKMLEYSGIIEEMLVNGDSDDITLEKFNELFDFQVTLLNKYNEWADADKAYWIAFMTERHELNEIPYTAFNDFVLPEVVLPDTANGNYVTHSELNDAITARVNAESALDERITALEDFDYSTLIPESLIEDVANNKSGLEAAWEAIDELQDAVIDLEDALSAHINDDSKHFTAGEKTKLANAVQPATLTSALATKADVNHTHDIADVDGLQESLDSLQSQLTDLPIPQDGNDGITPVISAGTVEEGEEFAVEITGPAEAPVFNFTLVKGDKGDAFQFDAIDTLANRSMYDAEEAGFIFLASDTGNYYIKNDVDWGDTIAFKGWNGWSPRFANFVVSSTKVVQEFLGWQGGTGTPPTLPYPIGVDPTTVRFFVGSAGLVTDAALAVNIMGPVGPDGEKGDTFTINAEGADRSIYDAQEKGFTFLNTANGKVSFKLTDTLADWSAEFQWRGADGEDGEDGEDGADSTVPGPPGDSAYDVAVANGFVGTEEEWLESLVGPEGPAGPGSSQKTLNVTAHGFSVLNVLGITEAGTIGLFDGTNEYLGIVIDVIDTDNFILQTGGFIEDPGIDEGDFWYAQTDGTIDVGTPTDTIAIIGVASGIGIVKHALAGGTGGGGSTPDLASVLAVDNDADSNQIKNGADATDPQDFTTLSQITSIVGTAFAGALPGVFFCSVAGDDGTAEEGNFLRPYTPAGAVSAASAGDTVAFLPGAYTINTNIFKAGVSYVTFGGAASITVTTSSAILFDLSAYSGSLPFSINGDFELILNASSGQLFKMNNNASLSVNMKVNKITLTSGSCGINFNTLLGPSSFEANVNIGSGYTGRLVDVYVSLITASVTLKFNILNASNTAPINSPFFYSYTGFYMDISYIGTGSAGLTTGLMQGVQLRLVSKQGSGAITYLSESTWIQGEGGEYRVRNATSGAFRSCIVRCPSSVTLSFDGSLDTVTFYSDGAANIHVSGSSINTIFTANTNGIMHMSGEHKNVTFGPSWTELYVDGVLYLTASTSLQVRQLELSPTAKVIGDINDAVIKTAMNGTSLFFKIAGQVKNINAGTSAYAISSIGNGTDGLLVLHGAVLQAGPNATYSLYWVGAAAGDDITYHMLNKSFANKTYGGNGNGTQVFAIGTSSDFVVDTSISIFS